MPFTFTQTRVIDFPQCDRIAAHPNSSHQWTNKELNGIDKPPGIDHFYIYPEHHHFVFNIEHEPTNMHFKSLSDNEILPRTHTHTHIQNTDDWGMPVLVVGPEEAGDFLQTFFYGICIFVIKLRDPRIITLANKFVLLSLFAFGK